MTARLLHRAAKRAAKAGQVDFAFMHYKTILVTAPESPYKDDALFAMGEYYFALSNYDEAEVYFKRYLLTEGTANGKLFAKAYLLKILEMKNSIDDAENLEEDILGSRNHTFIFRSHKDYKFVSPLGKMHKAIFAIDQVAFYTEGELIAEISY